MPWCLRIRLVGSRKCFNAGHHEILLKKINICFWEGGGGESRNNCWGTHWTNRFSNTNIPTMTCSMLDSFVPAVFLFLCSFLVSTIWWLLTFSSVTSIDLRQCCLVLTFVIFVRHRELGPVQGSLCKGWLCWFVWNEVYSSAKGVRGLL